MEAGALVAEDEDRHGNVRQVYLTQDERVLFLEPEGNIFEPQARDLSCTSARPSRPARTPR